MYCLSKNPPRKRNIPSCYHCMFCDHQIIWEKESLTYHLEKHHQCSVREYESKFSSELKEMHQLVFQSKGFQWNQCKFYCIMCSKFYNSRDSFKKHINLKHGLQMSDGTDHKQSIYNRHCCLICRTVVTFDKAGVENHFRVVHKMSIKEYEEKYYSELRVIFDSMSDGQKL